MKTWPQILPSLGQVLVYMLVGTFIALVYNRELLLGWLSGDYLEEINKIKAIASQEIYYLDTLASMPVLGNIIVWAMWGGIGCLIYCLWWGLGNTVKEVRKYEEATDDKKSVLPKGYSKAEFWESSISHIILLFASSAILVLILLFAFGFVLAISEQLILRMIVDTTIVDVITGLGLYILLSAGIGTALFLTIKTFNFARRAVFFL